MSVQEINPIQEFKDSIFSNGKEKELFKRDCRNISITAGSRPEEK